MYRLFLCFLVVGSLSVTVGCVQPDKPVPGEPPPPQAREKARAPDGGSADTSPQPDRGSGDGNTTPDLVPEDNPPPREEPPREPAYKGLLAAFFQSHGGTSAFTPHYVDALTSFFAIEHLYDAGKYKEARALLQQLWKKYPKGDGVWWRAGSRAKGTTVGIPVGYYGLRMLEEMLRFQESGVANKKAAEIVFSVVLVDCIKGIQPTTKKELEDGTGKSVTLRLQPALRVNNYAVIRQSLKLFGQYVTALTRGRLALKIEFVELSGCADGHTQTKPYRVAGLKSTAQLWSSIPEAVKKKTSWWWVLYPSLVPDKYPDFKTTEFITGGMGIGPNANSPCFIIDDQWLLRKPPHLGVGSYTEIERRAYLPQWLQHEFFHHLFRIYPAFGLEKTSHQWFDRKTWPRDFVGIFEPDYYAEALTKRLQTAQAQPPLHVHLRYEAPPASLAQSIKEADLLGTYLRSPKTNGWHEGVIEKVNGQLQWKNSAGARWTLTLSPNEGGLLTGPRNPYRNNPSGAIFRFSFKRGPDGEYLTSLNGFFFNGELYKKVK